MQQRHTNSQTIGAKRRRSEDTTQSRNKLYNHRNGYTNTQIKATRTTHETHKHRIKTDTNQRINIETNKHKYRNEETKKRRNKYVCK